MGGCFSDVRGGQQAVGGEGLATHAAPETTSTDAGRNEAVDLFNKIRGYSSLFTPIELSLTASKLRDKDIASKSDPMAVVYIKKRNGALEELGRTEVIMNNLEPTWIQKVNVNYQFEIVQPLVFLVYDVDTQYHNVPVKTINLKDQDFLGEASCNFSEIVTRQSQSLTLNLYNDKGHGVKSAGSLTVHAEETASSKTAVELIFRCANLDNKDFFSKSDPFLRISRIVEAGSSVPVCKTEVVNDNLNPMWKAVSLGMQHFGSKENPLIIECFDFNSNGDHVLIGNVQTSLSELERLHKERSGLHFVRPSSAPQGQDKILKGQLFINHYVEKSVYSFVDYISSGFELNFMVAVDFTGSNGNPRSPTSLHYIDASGRLNAYQQAITEVGDVIQFYDADKRFPSWGFGGRLPSGVVSHCFSLNGIESNPEVEGVTGILAAYASAIHNINLAGPTLFGQVIKKATEIAGHSLSREERKYFVLLVITDGVLTDVAETKNALVKASDLPLSVLIVGVGNADFSQMEELDADNGRRLQDSAGRVATRDIVQFVPMREVNVAAGQISVVQSLLEELPGQFLTFMQSRDIKPNSASLTQLPY
ncbi:unnamed protein product [Rhodiola kirilowii]